MLELVAGEAESSEPIAQLRHRIRAERNRLLDARSDREPAIAIERGRELDRSDQRRRELVEPVRWRDEVPDVVAKDREHVGGHLVRRGFGLELPATGDRIEHGRELGAHQVGDVLVDLDVDRVVIERGDHLERLAIAGQRDHVIVVVILAPRRRDGAMNREAPPLDVIGRWLDTQVVQRLPQHAHDLVDR